MVGNGQQAKQDGLQAGTLNRWVKYFDGTPKVAAAGVVEAAKDDGSARADRAGGVVGRRKPRRFQKQVKEMLAHREKAGRGRRPRCVQELFGEKGPFAVSGTMSSKKSLPAEKKQKFDALQVGDAGDEKVRCRRQPARSRRGLKTPAQPT